MTTATAQDRLRQIAILISSVDASAARQILLHLPTDKARRVRELASQLGTVSPQEKRKVLAEFQRSAAAGAPSQSKADNGSPSLPRPSREVAAAPTQQGYAAAVDTLAAQTAESPGYMHPGHGNYSPVAHNTNGHLRGAIDNAQTGWGPSAASSPHPSSNSWTHLSPAALIRFVRHERPAVTAVVISQLAPHIAVEVLQHLPAETNREVLLRLSRLGDIDPEAMQAIDEHLSQRLSEYQHSLASELENSRRMQLLLAAAPAELREQWSSMLAADSVQPPEINQLAGRQAAQAPTAPPAADQQAADQQAADHQENAWSSPATQPQDVLDISNSVYTTADTKPALTSSRVFGDSRIGGSAVGNESTAANLQPGQADILPFPPSAEQGNAPEAVDRSLIQIEFEQILHLPPWMLANLLSQTDSQLVLLALAGATPQFMKRFSAMLDRKDAKALQSRLQRIGPIRLRDVDEAQRRIIENALDLTKQEQLRRAVA